jgi:hypothetical protein
MYYLFSADHIYWNSELLTAKLISKIDDFDTYIWWSGVSYRIPTLTFAIRHEAPLLDIYRWIGGIDIYSEKFVSVLENFQVKMETFPVHVIDILTEQKVSCAYKVFHLLSSLSALDISKTEFAHYHSPTGSKEIIIPRRMVLSEEILLTQPPMFRIAEHRSIVVIHQALKEAIENEGITGGWFSPISEYIVEMSGLERIK